MKTGDYIQNAIVLTAMAGLVYLTDNGWWALLLLLWRSNAFAKK